MKQTYFNIPGWFNYSETYDIIVDKIPNDGVIVEIGSFLGRSTHYLATSLMNANKEQVHYTFSQRILEMVIDIPFQPNYFSYNW